MDGGCSIPYHRSWCLVAREDHVVDLDPDDAWSLLPPSGLGRLLYTKSALPVVRLLPFTLRDHTMVLPLDDDAWEALRHIIGSVVALEVDDLVDGWSVTVTSEVHQVKAPGEDTTPDPALVRWLSGTPTTYIQLEPTLVSGWRHQPGFADQQRVPAELPFPAPSTSLAPEDLEHIVSAVGQSQTFREKALNRGRQKDRQLEIFTNEHLDVRAMSWLTPEDDTGFHDHEKSCGAVYVLCGAIWYERLRLATGPARTSVPAGGCFAFDDTHIHRMRWKAGAGLTLTIHAYSPPLRQVWQYEQAESGLLHRTPVRAHLLLKPRDRHDAPRRATDQTSSRRRAW